MSDLEPMDPCPSGKRGAHSLMAVIPETSDGDLTLACQRCAAIRRVPVSGALLDLGTKDALTSDELDAMFTGWEVR